MPVITLLMKDQVAGLCLHSGGQGPKSALPWEVARWWDWQTSEDPFTSDYHCPAVCHTTCSIRMKIHLSMDTRILPKGRPHCFLTWASTTHSPSSLDNQMTASWAARVGGLLQKNQTSIQSQDGAMGVLRDSAYAPMPGPGLFLWATCHCGKEEPFLPGG